MSREACQALDDNALLLIKRPVDSGMWLPNKVTLARREEPKATGNELLTEHGGFPKERDP
jgi:hypothetical protein